MEQLILQTTLGSDTNTNSGVGDQGFRGPAWKNSPQSRQTATINGPYDKLSQLDYELHDHVTRVAESLDGLASPTGLRREGNKGSGERHRAGGDEFETHSCYSVPYR
jgi:hypothetical protein